MISIPEEAVEAASAYMDGAFDYISSPTEMRVAMREALAAAAPHMLEEAWRDGCAEGLACDWDKGAEHFPLNPYRSNS